MARFLFCGRIITMMNVKFFTPKEANQRLPYVKQIVADILEKGKQAQALMSVPRKTPESDKKLLVLDNQIKGLMAELEAVGCYYKDWNFEIGLVDFPAIINGREALLCWRSDEPQVAWFHGHDDGYAGRQPITAQLIFS